MSAAPLPQPRKGGSIRDASPSPCGRGLRAARGNPVPPLRLRVRRVAPGARRRSSCSSSSRCRDLRRAGSRRRIPTTWRSSTSWTAACRRVPHPRPATPICSAPTTRAATCSPASCTGCASRSASASARRSSPCVVGTALGLFAAYARRTHRHRDHAAGRSAALVSLHPRRADDPRHARQGRDERRARAGDRRMGLLRAHRARAGHGGTPARIHRGRRVPRAAEAGASCSAICCRTACRR